MDSSRQNDKMVEPRDVVQIYNPANEKFYKDKPYLQLNPKGSEIRVLRISLRADHKPVECQIDDKIPLARINGQYCVLSYCGADPKNTAAILVNGLDFKADAHLEHSIRCLCTYWLRKFPDEELLLWTGQICIDQSDQEERSSQSQLVPEILRRAHQTFACLSNPNIPDCLSWVPQPFLAQEGSAPLSQRGGALSIQALKATLKRLVMVKDATEFVEPASQIPAPVVIQPQLTDVAQKALILASRIMHRQSASLGNTPPRIPPTKSTATTSNHALNHMQVDLVIDPDAFQRSLQSFIANPWWRRAWVYQEFMISKNMWFLSGVSAIQWEELSPLIDFIIYDLITFVDSINQHSHSQLTKVREMIANQEIRMKKEMEKAQRQKQKQAKAKEQYDKAMHAYETEIRNSRFYQEWISDWQSQQRRREEYESRLNARLAELYRNSNGEKSSELDRLDGIRRPMASYFTPENQRLADYEIPLKARIELAWLDIASRSEILRTSEEKLLPPTSGSVPTSFDDTFIPTTLDNFQPESNIYHFDSIPPPPNWSFGDFSYGFQPVGSILPPTDGHFGNLLNTLDQASSMRDVYMTESAIVQDLESMVVDKDKADILRKDLWKAYVKGIQSKQALPVPPKWEEYYADPRPEPVRRASYTIEVSIWEKNISVTASLQNQLRSIDFSAMVSMAKRKAAFKHTTNLDLKDLLRHARNCEAFDPRDLIYAFLSMAHPKYQLIPSYESSNSIQAVLIETAKCIIQADESLEILAHVHRGRKNQGRTIPTWVPDWTSKETWAEDEQEQTGPSFDASKGRKSAVEFRKDASYELQVDLKVEGVFIGSLVKEETYRTDDGYISFFQCGNNLRVIAPQTARLHDEIWVLIGAKSPVLLKPERIGVDQKMKTYGFSGEVVVCDLDTLEPSEIMYGEMIDKLDSSGAKKEEIWII